MDDYRDNAPTVLSYDAIQEPPVGKQRLLEFDKLLIKYKAGKARLERRVIASEEWWRLRNEREEQAEGVIEGEGFRARTGWLHNVIVSKHADAMENYPEPIILPREPGDRQQAQTLSKVLPCILEQNRFEKTYDVAMWQKLKTGTAVYQVIWDADKLNGMGDITIRRVDLLKIFWEPGIDDIQSSRYVFLCELRDNELLEREYPQLAGKLKSRPITLSQFRHEDTVDLDGKSYVIDVYYKERADGRDILHYCKYCNDEILVSTENDGSPLYEHGKYPFVFDTLWPIEGSPCGYGFVDLCKNPQTQIDIMDTAFTKNTLVGATPRYFSREGAGINEQEFLDLNKPIVHVKGGNLDSTVLQPITHDWLGGAYMNVYEAKIAELRETSGNTETANGVTGGGVTAASAIAALQEASGKTSRDMTQASYRAFADIVDLCIELIRQFYTLPRQFRITGKLGQEDFTMLSNAPMLPRAISYGGEVLGVETPLFDIKVKVQKRNVYTRTAQNELALQLYGQGFFNPELATQAMMCLDMMDFEGKDELAQKIAQNGMLYQQLQQTQQLVLGLLQKYEQESVEPMAAAMGMAAPAMPQGTGQSANLQGESGVTANARQKAARTTEVAG